MISYICVEIYCFLLSHLTNHVCYIRNYSSHWYNMELKLHAQLDTSCIYYVWKYYIFVCDHSENIDNLLHLTLFETPSTWTKALYLRVFFMIKNQGYILLHLATLPPQMLCICMWNIKKGYKFLHGDLRLSAWGNYDGLRNSVSTPDGLWSF